jgi:hypothetical protein
LATDFLNKTAKSNEVYFKCYISSESAQIQFDLSPKIIKDISATGLKIHFSILSWGNTDV